MCEDCPMGTYCLSGEGIQLCPAGHYCLGGGVEAILPCPPGTYSPHFGLSQVEQCLICPAGESVVIWLLPLLTQTHKVLLLEMCRSAFSPAFFFIFKSSQHCGNGLKSEVLSHCLKNILRVIFFFFLFVCFFHP